MPLIVPYHTIFYTESAPEILHFDVILGGYNTWYSPFTAYLIAAEVSHLSYGDTKGFWDTSEAMDSCV